MIINENEFRRCRVFHVVPLTFTFGFVKVILHVAVIVMICTLLMKPDLMDQHETHNKVFGCLCKNKFPKSNQQQQQHQLDMKTEKRSTNDVTILLDFKMKTEEISGKLKPKESSNNRLDNNKIFVENKITQLYWALLMTLFYLMFSLMLLQGLLTKNASNMLPFFCLQLFDFVLDLLWLFGHLIVSSDISKLEMEFNCLPIGRYFHNMNPAVSSFIILMLCVAGLMLRFFFIGVVWSSYRYIIASRCQILPTSTSGSGSRPSSTIHRNGMWGLDLWQIILSPKHHHLRRKLAEIDDAVSDDLPKYEEVLNTPINTYNPPPYVEKTTEEKVTDSAK